jgi:hypothetical protein
LENNSLQILQALNVIESDLATLRMAELAHALQNDEEARMQLDAFDAIWAKNTQQAFALARSEALKRALHETTKPH